MARTLQAIAEHLGGVLEGDGSVSITGLAGLLDAGPGDLSFLFDPRYRRHAERTGASALLIARDAPPARLPAVRVPDIDAALDKLLEWFRPERPAPRGGVDPRALVGEGARIAPGATVMGLAAVMEGAQIGSGTVLHPGAYAGAGAVVGRDCVLHPNVVVGERVRIGDRVVIHAGAVIGADGFGYRPGPRGLCKLEHIGAVRIEDDVEIGAGATIDRARFGDTVIGKGSKIDNLVQVAHNVRVGSHTVIAAQTGISGSAILGDRCLVGGQVGVVGHVRVGDGCQVAARSGISKDVPDGAVLYGFVARDHLEKKREEAALRRLPELLRRMRALEAEVRALRQAGGKAAGP